MLASELNNVLACRVPLITPKKKKLHILRISPAKSSKRLKALKSDVDKREVINNQERKKNKTRINGKRVPAKTTPFD